MTGEGLEATNSFHGLFPPLAKGGEGGIFRKEIIHKISPPSLRVVMIASSVKDSTFDRTGTKN
jgi:hypothetical protein